MLIDRLQRSRRKTVALYVRPDGSLEVRAPLRLSHSAIQAFVDSKSDWILRQRKKLVEHPQTQRKDGYANGDAVWFLGGILKIDFVSGNPRQIISEGDRLIVPVRFQNELEPALTAWYRTQCRRILSARVDFFSKKYALRYNGLRITSARSRWGSCGANNRLNFPFRLVMAPLDIIDYVVVHELVHTTVHNHGKGFWANVSAILPDYALRRRWLKINGHLFDLNLLADQNLIVPVHPKTRSKSPAK